MLKLIKIISFMNVAIFAASLSADQVILRNSQKKDTTIREIKGEKILSSDGEIPLANVKSIIFDSFNVAAKSSGIILSDGTKLSGIIKAKDSSEFLFRSTSLGVVKIPRSQVAVEYIKAFSVQPEKQPIPFLICSGGKIIAGKIMWFDQNSAGIRTESGLKKIESSQVVAAIYSNFSNTKKIVLRNGDIINKEPIFNGKEISFEISGEKFSLPLTAIKEINF